MRFGSIRLDRISLWRPFLAAILFVNNGSGVTAETMREAVDRAFSNSDARQVAIKSIEAQNEQVGIAQGDRGVTVDVFGELALENVDDSTRSGQQGNNETQTARQIALSASYPLFDGGQSLYQVFQEAARLDAEIIRLSDATETIALNAVQAYIDVFRRQNIANIAQENIDIHTKTVEQVESQIEAGKLSEPDRFLANDKLLDARLIYADAKASLSDAISNYQFVIGGLPRGALAVSALSKLPANRAAAEETAVRNSYLLRIAQKDIDALTYQEVIDLGNWQPAVDLFLRGGYEKDVDGEPGHETAFSGGLRLNWTLYKGGTKQRTVARNRDLVMRAHYRKKQVEDEVRNLARKAWNSYIASVERRELLNNTVINNEKIVEAFKREFEAAKRPLLDILDAERSLFAIKVQKSNAEAAVAFRQYRILASQSLLGKHFGLNPFGTNLAADFDSRVRALPRGNFDIDVPPLNEP